MIKKAFLGKPERNHTNRIEKNKRKICKSYEKSHGGEHDYNVSGKSKLRDNNFEKMKSSLRMTTVHGKEVTGEFFCGKDFQPNKRKTKLV